MSFASNRTFSVPLATTPRAGVQLTKVSDFCNRARWAIALALVLRQGEVLGLRWSDVDLERGLL